MGVLKAVLTGDLDPYKGRWESWRADPWPGLSGILGEAYRPDRKILIQTEIKVHGLRECRVTRAAHASHTDVSGLSEPLITYPE